ncbi:hypothetical protein [Halobiforma nitratireducens]|uniref:hypothetical protein n=1 Tax=Halobiforma nitratireducens TaxID=130048 RepID=UPI001EFA016B|nr:hypothetical protein [Halobiforma nitratireducens]
MIATIGSALACGVTEWGSARQNDPADEPATEPGRTVTSNGQDGAVATDDSSAATTGGDPDATNEITETTDDEAGCGCPG